MPYAAYSTRKLPRIPEQTCHPLQEAPMSRQRVSLRQVHDVFRLKADLR